MEQASALCLLIIPRQSGDTRGQAIITVNRSELPIFSRVRKEPSRVGKMLVQFGAGKADAKISSGAERLDRRGAFDKSEIFAARHPFQAHRLLEMTGCDAADKWDLINAKKNIRKLHVRGCELELSLEKDGTG